MSSIDVAHIVILVLASIDIYVKYISSGISR